MAFWQEFVCTACGRTSSCPSSSRLFVLACDSQSSASIGKTRTLATLRRPSQIVAVIDKDPEGEHILTDFGREVRRHSLDLRLGVLQAVCARFDLGWHGRIAATYIAAQCDVFIKHATGGPTAGLHPDQLQRAHDGGFGEDREGAEDARDISADSGFAVAARTEHNSDLHTAVKLFLEYVASYYAEPGKTIINCTCFAKM